MKTRNQKAQNVSPILIISSLTMNFTISATHQQEEKYKTAEPERQVLQEEHVSYRSMAMSQV